MGLNIRLNGSFLIKAFEAFRILLLLILMVVFYQWYGLVASVLILMLHTLIFYILRPLVYMWIFRRQWARVEHLMEKVKNDARLKDGDVEFLKHHVSEIKAMLNKEME